MLKCTMGTRRRKRKKLSTALSRKLFAFREKYDLTQQAAADKLGVTKRAWIKWESDGAIPSPAYAKLIEQLLAHPSEFHGS